MTVLPGRRLSRRKLAVLAVLAVPVLAYLVQLYFAVFGYTLLKTRVFDAGRTRAVDIVVYRGREPLAYLPALGVLTLLGPAVKTDVMGPKGRVHLWPDDDSMNVRWEQVTLERAQDSWVLDGGELKWDVPLQCVHDLASKPEPKHPENPMAYVVSVWIKFFFLLTPFFVTSMFLTMTRDRSEGERRRLAVRVTLAIVAVCAVLYFFGNVIFALFGITVDAFRVGAGGLLFLTAVGLVRGSGSPASAETEGDIAVVPLAIPMTVGPATTGALLVMGAQAEGPFQRFAGFGALCAAVVSVGALLFLAAAVERLVGRKGITILTKLTGLVLAALAAQMAFAGARNLLHPPA